MAKNSLESFLYEFKDTLFSDTTEQLSTDEERTKINEKFSEISDWLDEDGFDSTPEVISKILFFHLWHWTLTLTPYNVFAIV